MENSFPTQNEEKYGEILSSEKAFTSSRFSTEIDVHVSKLRRWSLELEKVGYNIMRDEFDNRVYLESDKETFLKLKEFIEVKKLKAEDSYKSIAAMFSDSDYKHRLPVTKEEQKTIHLTYEELQQMLNQAAEVATAKLLNNIEKHNEFLLNSFNETMKIQQQQTQLLLEQKTEEETPKKSFFARFFS
jgi:hypothetical protein